MLLPMLPMKVLLLFPLRCRLSFFALCCSSCSGAVVAAVCATADAADAATAVNAAAAAVGATAAVAATAAAAAAAVDNGFTALILASQNGHSGIVPLLLSAGANANAATTDDSLTMATQR